MRIPDEYEPTIVVEISAQVFGDTLLEVTSLDANAGPYVIGEGPEARLVVSGEGLPDPAGFALVRPLGELGFALAFTATMTGTVDGRSLEQLRGDDRTVREPGYCWLLLEPGEVAWIEHRQLRLQVCVIERPDVELAGRPLDRSFAASLLSCMCLALVFFSLLRMQPPEQLALDDDARAARLAHLLAPERPLPPEPGSQPRGEYREAAAVPGASIDVPPVDRAWVDRGARPGFRWAPGSPDQAVGKFARSYDPIEAARHAGILGVLGERAFVGDQAAFAVSIEDRDIWDPKLPDYNYASLLVGGDRRGLNGGMGVIGLGSSGVYAKAGQLRERRAPSQSSVHVGRLDISGDISPDVARRVVRGHRGELAGCYERFGSRSSMLASIRLIVVVAGGEIRDVTIEFSGVLDAALYTCLTHVALDWSFPGARYVNIIEIPLTFGS